MTTRQEVIDTCLTLPFAYEDYPFGEEWAIMRHRENDKIFAMIFQRQGHIWINVKAEPLKGDFWRQLYPAVVPAYHMNKQHWVSIILDGSMKKNEIFLLIQDSFELTLPKRRKKKSVEETK